MRIKFEYKLLAAYLFLGGMWILFSDKVLYIFIQEASILTKIQTFKGWFYVFITGMFFFFFLKKHLTKLRNIERELIIKNEELIISENQLKQRNKEIKIAIQKTKDSDRLKSEFINNLSHEIRTPLNGIIGFSGLLSRENLPRHEKLRFITQIEKSNTKLLKVIDDILEVSSLVKKQIKTNIKEFSISELLNGLYFDFCKVNKNTNIQFILNNESHREDIKIISDRELISKIFYNLLDNAFKFTSRGMIELSYFKKTIDGIEYVAITVKDTGVGISQEKIDFVFDYFNQEEFEVSKKFGGLGLGLSITKGYIALLDGKIQVESQKGKGALFIVSFPFSIKPNYSG